MDVKQVKAYGVFCTIDKLKLMNCQYAIDRFYEIDESLPKSQIRILAQREEDNVLMIFNDKDVGELTPFFYEIFEDIKSFQPKLVVLDGSLDLFCRKESDPFCMNEMDSLHIEKFMQDCCSYIAETLNSAK